MTTEPQPTPEPPSSSAPSLAMWVMFVILAAGIVALWIANNSRPAQKQSQLIGRPAPQITAEGWLNGTAPTGDDLAGKVVLIDAWAHWCGPCRRLAPHLVQLHEKYKDRGVVFIGLTSEDSSTLDKSKAFLEQTHITWLQGYGAHQTLDELDVNSIPRVFIIDRDGTIAWDMSLREDPDDVLDRLTSAPQ